MIKRSLFRPLPTFFLVGLTVVVAASCVADNDEPLALSESAESAAVATPEAEVKAAPAAVNESAVARVLRNAFPQHANRVLGKLQTRGFVSIDGGFARGPSESLAMHLDVHLPSDAQEPIRLTAPGGHEIRVRQIDVQGKGELAEHAVAYRRAGGTSFWTVTNGGAEEWLHLEEGTITSDLDIAAEWEIEGATPVLMDGHVGLMDAEGVARAWVTAPEAFGANGRNVDLRLAVEGQRIQMFADAQGEEVLLDPGWVAVAPTADARAIPTVVALNTGKVLFANGLLAGNMVSTTTQLYDPATNTWAAGPAVTLARVAQRECLLTTGLALVSGGNSVMGITATAERYNPATNAWSAAGSMVGARMYHTLTALTTGNAVAAGGYDGTNMIATVSIYNGTTNTWSAGPAMSKSRGLASAVRLANGKVLVVGGLTGNAGAFAIDGTAEVYDPVANTWSATGALTVPRYQGAIGLLTTGKVILAGGFDGTGAATATAETYDPATNTWTAIASRTITTGTVNGVTLGTGRFLVFGGDDGTAVTANSDAFNPTTGLWSPAGNMNSPREDSGAAILTGGDALVVDGATAFDANGNYTAMTSSVDRYQAALSANGASCTQGAQCTSGFCVDGVCCTVSACTASDTCHNVGTCTAGTGICSNPAKPNGSVCNDGNGCTQTDTCQAGICSGANPKVCTASDQCHDAGVCNPVDGSCSNPAKTNGTVCNDGNACTQVDSCQAGTCTGATPVVCTASDQCHDVGTCNTTTGMCSNPAKMDGSSCNDGNACTQTDTCQAGACTGANPKTCTASDQCHDAGTCNTTTGMCSNPAKMDGSMCNDGNACTQSDTCQAGACTGAMPVTCTAMDQCHDAGTCNTMTGMCSNPAKMDGASCNDGNACTQSDTCQAGSCTGAMPVTCTAMDQCHDAGTCDTTTGMCSNPAKADGASCDDGDLCTQTDSCTAGACTGGNPVTCTASDQCHDVGTCDSTTGLCSDPAKADGASCDDGDGCTQTDTCAAGVCTGAMPVTCTALDECHDAGTCDMASGACSNPAKADGTPCTGGTCQLGECMKDGSSSSSSGVGGAGGGSETGGSAGSSAGGSGGGTTTDPGGCSCTVVGSDDSTTSSALAGLALAALGMVRRRRSARS